MQNAGAAYYKEELINWNATLNFYRKEAIGLEDLNIRIFTSKGKLVSEENISGAGSHKINMSQVDSGIYFIELSGREGKATQRWVKQ